MFQGLFLNLARNRERHDAMLQQLDAIGAADRYRRFEAVDGRAVAHQFATSLQPGELGVWLSTLEILRQNVDSPVHLHVVEDDVVFSQAAVAQLEEFLVTMEQRQAEWDILFTELFVCADPMVFRSLSEHVRAYRIDGHMSLVPLKHWWFAGFTSYVVNKRSIPKLLALLEGGWASNDAVDIFVRSLIWDKKVSGYVTVPFVTTLSPLNDQSDIRGAVDVSRLAIDFIRRAFFADADIPALARQASALSEGVTFDDLSAILMHVVAFMLSPGYSEF